jgi:2-oxoisovalerate dehydrogenase E1 component
MHLSRLIDAAERELVQRGEAHFHVSGAGHEAVAALADYLKPCDFLHLHYRDKALIIARGIPLEEFFRSVYGHAGSHSAGRQMSAHLSWPPLNVTSMVGPVGNNALHAIGTAAVLKEREDRAISLCAVGDGTTQQGEFLEAVAEAERLSVPVLFLVEDNGIAISTRTGGKTFFNGNDGPRDRLFGLDIARFDGSDSLEAAKVFETAIARMRRDRKPAILVGKFARLSDHTNSDDQSAYLSKGEIDALARHDPILRLQSSLLELGESKAELAALEASCRNDVQQALERSRTAVAAPASTRGERAPLPATFANDGASSPSTGDAGHETMRQAINEVLRSSLAGDSRVTILGQDIEDPKGDVFGITKGLSTAFPGRVMNASLSESIIVGTSIGRALAGQRPVACIQFADFLPLAANQIIAELSTMYWRTNGGWSAPVVIMAPIGGYKPGLGPFHGESYEAMFAQCPGLNVVCPSTAADAAGLLRAALTAEQPTLFLYPKALLNRRDRAGAPQHIVPAGQAGFCSRGDDLTLLGWGNTAPICEEVADRLQQAGLTVDTIDLRSLSPWDRQTVIDSVRKTGHLVIAQEDRRSFGVGAEIAATVAEALGPAAKIRRVARADTYIPYNFDDQLAVLPSFRSVLDACAALLGLTVEWQEAVSDSSDAIHVIGSGPADDVVRIVELRIEEDQNIKEGDLVAIVEASKAAVEIHAPRAGRISQILCAVGDDVAVGSALARFAAEQEGPVREAVPAGQLSVSIRVPSRGRVSKPTNANAGAVAVADIAIAAGARRISTEELCRRWPDVAPAALIRMTGIRSRHWIGEGQSVFTLASDAFSALTAHRGFDAKRLGLVVAATGSPDQVTPSLAARVCSALGLADIATYDINAACSGYLYAVQAVHDYLAHNPERTAVVITSEALSPLLNRDDPETTAVFGDAATATLLHARQDSASNPSRLFIERPLISGRPEPGEALSVPLPDAGTIAMNGRLVFAEAVPGMEQLVRDVCHQHGIDLSSLDFLVPHQANQKVLDALGRRLGRPVVNVVGEWGNTSSSSIPIALNHLLASHNGSAQIALAAFGGGFTSAAALARIVP